MLCDVVNHVVRIATRLITYRFVGGRGGAVGLAGSTLGHGSPQRMRSVIAETGPGRPRHD